MAQRYRKRVTVLALLAGLLSGVGLLIAQVDTPMEPRDEVVFLQSAALGCLWRVESGTVAARQGAAEAAKSFGQHMVTRYSGLGREVATLAWKKGIGLPGKLDRSQQSTLEYMAKQRGAGIDREYVSMMADDLSGDLKNFKRASRQAQDPDIQAFAARAVRGLEEDLSLAERVLRDLPQPILK